MHKYIARRLLLAIPTILGATTLIFIIMHVVPGDIARIILRGDDPGMGITSFRSLERLREEMGLNRPLFVQYFAWLGDVATGDLGNSLWSGRPVLTEILHRLPITFQIALMTIGLGFIIGVPIGIICAIRQDRWPDYTLRVFSIFTLAIPSFWTGLMIIVIGARYFGWIPPVGYHPIWQDPLLNLKQLIWPAVAGCLNDGARNARMARSTMLEVLREDYIRTARAKGLREVVVHMRHALKNTMIPVVTFASIYFGTSLGGAVILENVFSIPGLGRLFVESIQVRDFIMVQGLIFWMVLGFILVNLFVDLLYGWLDPRISYE